MVVLWVISLPPYLIRYNRAQELLRQIILCYYFKLSRMCEDSQIFLEPCKFHTLKEHC
jgi:hypothetical protein